MSDIFASNGIHSNPIVMLAPMEGVTNAIFRDLVCAKGGVDLVSTEFVRITGERQKVAQFRYPKQQNIALQIQLMACDVQILKKCIEFLQNRLQLNPTDWLDLNVGCPSKKVNAKGAGAALLREPKKLLEIIYSMRSVHSGPLSIKTRPAFDSLKEYPPLLKVLRCAPLDFITIHARPRIAGHSGPVHFDVLKRAVEALPYPVIGNGEIWTAQDAAEMIDNTGVRGVMCGRGVLKDPCLLSEVSCPNSALPPERKRSELSRFTLTLAAHYAEASSSKKNYAGTFKEFAGWISKNPLVGKGYFECVKRCGSMTEILSASRRYLEDNCEVATAHPTRDLNFLW